MTYGFVGVLGFLLGSVAGLIIGYRDGRNAGLIHAVRKLMHDRETRAEILGYCQEWDAELLTGMLADASVNQLEAKA